MNQYELLKELDDWASGGGPVCNEGAEIAELMRLAAAEIRRLASAENDQAALMDEYQTGTNQMIRMPRQTRTATLVIHDGG